jgi:hypothetical protein
VRNANNELCPATGVSYENITSEPSPSDSRVMLDASCLIFICSFLFPVSIIVIIQGFGDVVKGLVKPFSYDCQTILVY